MNGHQKSVDWTILRTAVVSWAEGEDINYPWREEIPPWQALVTEVLLQRTRAEAVKEVYMAFFQRFPTPQALAEAGVEEVEEAIASLGLRWRAKYLPLLGEELSKKVPDNQAELLKLPGVGPYAAAAYLSLHHNESVPIVDANIVRLLGRYCGFAYDGETRRKKWFLSLVEEFFDNEYSPSLFGYAVLDFTRIICGRTPKCHLCEARSSCDYSIVSSTTQENGNDAI